MLFHLKAAGQFQVMDVAAFKAIQHDHQLIPGRFALRCMRRRHETAPASVIAAAGYRPLHPLLDPRRIKAVFPIWKQVLIFIVSQTPYESASFPMIITPLLLVAQLVPINPGLAIA